MSLSLELTLALALVGLGATVGIAVCAFVKRRHAQPAETAALEESLDELMKLNKADISVIVPKATEVIARVVEGLAKRVEKFDDSTSRLGLVNVALALIIAVATVAYTVVTWLEYAHPR